MITMDASLVCVVLAFLQTLVTLRTVLACQPSILLFHPVVPSVVKIKEVGSVGVEQK